MVYRSVVKLKYNNKLFQMYINSKNERFFLEILSDGNYYYPTLDDLIGLEYIFANHDTYKCSFKDIGSFKDFVPKVIYRGVPVVLSASLLLFACNRVENENSKYQRTPTSIEDIQTDLGFTVRDQEERLVLDTFYHSDKYKYDYVFDSKYLDHIFDTPENISEAMLIEAINNNPSITGRYVDLLKDFCHRFVNKYPNADLRILYNNLLSIKIVECETKEELDKYTNDDTSYACYMRSENTFYTLKGYEYKIGTIAYQIAMHELSHTSRTYWRDINNDGKVDIKAQFEGVELDQVSIMEAMNSLFTVGLFDYDEKIIAYQLQSNYLSVLIESLDNYSLGDYINHSMSYFASKLDEAHGDNNYASLIFELIETQYKDYHSDKIEISEEEYYPIYDYIADFYFSKHITPGMSKSEMIYVCDDLVSRIIYGVNEGYHIDSNHFYVYLEEYIQKHGFGNYSR